MTIKQAKRAADAASVHLFRVASRFYRLRSKLEWAEEELVAAKVADELARRDLEAASGEKVRP